METNNKPTLYWSFLEFHDWNFYMASTFKGLVFVGSQNNSIEELFEWAKKRLIGSSIIKDQERNKPYAAEIIQYLEGTRKNFTVPFEYIGTPFQLSVWNEVRNISYGQTKSYTDIANELNKPTAARAVGTAIGANPLLITVPCHRVIGKDGSLTGYRGGIEMKEQLLNLEFSKSSLLQSD
ncbi:O6-methylguanine-DNA methyltransferase [Bacillus sp. TS-2]|nr:O6-methylguanine-DNA methyltransferase [Bacillus sp. TS-2]